jgi:hypothetical protein
VEGLKLTNPYYSLGVSCLKRTTVAISEATARRLSELSRKHKIVISALATEALEVACDAMDMGFTPRDLRDLIVILKLASFIDPVLLPIDVVEKLVLMASRDSGVFDTLLRDFNQLGARVASAAISYYGAPANIEELLKTLTIASKLSAFKEVRAVRRGEELEVSIIGSWKTFETSRLIEAFVRGAFETLGYTVKEAYVGVGSLKVTVTPKGYTA